MTKQVNFFEKNPEFGLCATKVREMGKTENYWFNSDHIPSLLLFNATICHPSVMFNRSALKESILYPKEYIHAEDYALWISIIQQSKIEMLNEILLDYRVNAGQVTNRFSEEQKKSASKLRKKYLEQRGFTFTQEQLRLHNLIGSNEKITSKSDLEGIEKWFNELLRQNNSFRTFDKTSFEFVLSKLWLDSCGNTSLGLYSYSAYTRSSLKNAFMPGIGEKIKLFAKCLIR